MSAGARVTRVRGFYGVVDLRPELALEHVRGHGHGLEQSGIEGVLAAHVGKVDGPAHGTERERERLLVRGMELARQLLGGGAGVVQLRMKRSPVRVFLDVAAAVQPIVHAAGALFIVNDRLDVALAVGADGVHLGQDDLPLDAARSAAAGQLLIGISTHSPAQAAFAARGGADYLGFGPVYATSTKEDPDPVQGIDGLLAAVSAVSAATAGMGSGAPPIVAIGGITPELAREVAAAGAAAACVISAVNSAPDVTAAARRVAAAFGRRIGAP